MKSDTKGKKILIVGPAASGKDWLQQKFIEKGYKPLIQYTTRPKRPTENGSEYNFVSPEVMGEMIRDFKFLSVKSFNGWWYGFSKDDFDNCNVGIVSIGNIIDLKHHLPNLSDICEIIYLDMPIELRISRLGGRYNGGKEDDTIERRVQADKNDFENFNLYDTRLCSEKEVCDFINTIQELFPAGKEETK